MTISIFEVLWIMNPAFLVATLAQVPSTIPDPPTLAVTKSKLTTGCSTQLRCTMPNAAYEIHWQRIPPWPNQRHFNQPTITYSNMDPTQEGLFFCAKCVLGLTSYRAAASQCIASNVVEIVVEVPPPPIATTNYGLLIDLTDPAALLNNNVEMTCNIDCPDVNFLFTWFWNGQPRQQTKTFNYQFRTSSENGYYQCSVKHTVSNLESKKSNEIRVMIAGTFGTCQDCVGGDLERDGGTATFECSANSVGPGKLVDATYIAQISVDAWRVNQNFLLPLADYTPLDATTGLAQTGPGTMWESPLLDDKVWKFEFDGGLQDSDTNTSQINNVHTARVKVVISDSSCDIAGLYRCSIYHMTTQGGMKTYSVQQSIFIASKVDTSLGHFKVEKTGDISGEYAFTCSAQFNYAAARLELTLLPCVTGRFANTSDPRLSEAFTDFSNEVCDEMVPGGSDCRIHRTVTRHFKFTRDMCTARCAIFTETGGAVTLLDYHDFHFKDVCKVSDKIHKLWKWYSTVLAVILAVATVAGTIGLIKLFSGGGLNFIIQGVSCVLCTLVMSTCGQAVLCVLVVSEACLDAVVPRYRASWARLGAGCRTCLDRLQGKKDPLKQKDLSKTVRKDIIPGQMKNLTGVDQAKIQAIYRGRERARSHVSYWSEDSGKTTMFS